MPERAMFSRWDPLNPTNILAAILLLFAFGVWHRPNITLLYPSYLAFDDLMPWAWWGWSALLIALLLLFTPRFSGWRMFAHGLCGTYFLAVAGAFGAGIGVASGVTTYTVLACVSGILFARTA
ncbi:hypothetical protein, partial [Deinococcus wulumuqiensis]|uniref:hypothetical protein n=1 Tax=Deinococcus wulumuqiensis TaxID=980427 RepID=UPI002431B750